mgnify:CR=1 FL=1
MNETMRLFTGIQEEPLDVNAWLEQIGDSTHGATSMFLGTVRNHDPQAGDQGVTGIEYSAHPDATEILQQEVCATVDEVLGTGEASRPLTVVAIHRVGKIAVGEAAMLVIVSGAHRNPSMELVPAIVERIKATIPVWKKQSLDDGSTKWSNLP